jgi:hypothetical protein
MLLDAALQHIVTCRLSKKQLPIVSKIAMGIIITTPQRCNTLKAELFRI